MSEDPVCRVCGSDKIIKILDMGDMPNANGLLLKEDLKRVKSYPLKYYWCSGCSFFQQIDQIPKEKLFSDFYTYQTGINTPVVEHFRKFAERMRNELDKKDFAVVCASNDGTEIAALKEYGKFGRVIGVEPAGNLAVIANKNGLETINAFFSRNLGMEISSEYGNADLVIANNVFAHIPDPVDFLMGMKEVAGNEGRISIEVHWLLPFLKEVQIETLYGEHYYVWSVNSMRKVAERCGLVLSEVEVMEKQHGGSIRATFLVNGIEGDSVRKLVDKEIKEGVLDRNRMERLQEEADKRKKDFIELVGKLKSGGSRIAIWTVPAKISTLLNFAGITVKEIECAYDATPGKIGKYIPKAEIPIKDESKIGVDMPDYLIVGAWNYMEFGREKLKWYLERGGALVNPLTSEIIRS